MKNRITFKQLRSYTDGQFVSAEGIVQLPQLSPETLTRKIAEANHFDYEALAGNRSGRLDFSQVFNALQVIGIVFIMLVALVWLMVNLPSGVTYLNSGEYQQALLPCGSSIVGIILMLGLFLLGKKISFERYSVKNIFELPRRLLLIFDLLRGRVEIFEGLVSRDEVITTYESSTSQSFSKRQTRHTYFYLTAKDVSTKPEGVFSFTVKDAFKVSEEGYDVFPANPQNCRLYYLPLSKVIVNLEVL